MKRILLLFVIAFVLNAIWEHAHSLLYESYQNGHITELILFRATLADAVMITAIVAPFIYLPSLQKHCWLIFVIGSILAIGIELYALSTGRWVYNEYMPLIPLFPPLVSVGLTPIIQLGLLGYISYSIQQYLSSFMGSITFKRNIL